MIGSPYLAGRDRYERVMEGWVDNTHDTAFTHTVRITDPAKISQAQNAHITVLIEHRRRAIRVDSGSVPKRTARSKPSSMRSTRRSSKETSIVTAGWAAANSARIGETNVTPKWTGTLTRTVPRGSVP